MKKLNFSKIKNNFLQYRYLIIPLLIVFLTFAGVIASYGVPNSAGCGGKESDISGDEIIIEENVETSMLENFKEEIIRIDSNGKLNVKVTSGNIKHRFL